MRYEILYKDAFPVVKCHLERGERIKAESDAMIAMSGNLTVEGKREGSIFGGLARKFLTGESFFFQEIKAERGAGDVLFAHALPGGILDVALDGSYQLCVEKNGFLAATSGVNIDTKVQNLMQGFFSKEGFFILKVSGRGTVFISSYGAIHPMRIEAGEELIVDNGHLVAWPEYMKYEIQTASSGWFSSMTSGEGLVCKFRGPGTVLIQTRNPEAFTEWIRGMVPMRQG